MRIFPEGVQDAMPAVGKAIIILALCMLALGVVIFGLKTWVLYAWTRTTGTVVSAHVETSTDNDGTQLCSAAETVAYSVDGRDLVVHAGGHTFTNDCPEIAKRVQESKGQSRTVIYNKWAPGATYVNPGFNIDFYLVPFVLTCMSVGFAFAGWSLIRIYNWMETRELKLP